MGIIYTYLRGPEEGDVGFGNPKVEVVIRTVVRPVHPTALGNGLLGGSTDQKTTCMFGILVFVKGHRRAGKKSSLGIGSHLVSIQSRCSLALINNAGLP